MVYFHKQRDSTNFNVYPYVFVHNSVVRQPRMSYPSTASRVGVSFFSRSNPWGTTLTGISKNLLNIPAVL